MKTNHAWDEATRDILLAMASAHMFNPSRSSIRTPAVVQNKDWSFQARVYNGAMRDCKTQKIRRRWIFTLHNVELPDHSRIRHKIHTHCLPFDSQIFLLPSTSLSFTCVVISVSSNILQLLQAASGPPLLFIQSAESFTILIYYLIHDCNLFDV